jgi:hypothetical protein
MRWITHLCAPGFFLLMGAGMSWFAAARADAGWTGRQITRFFVTRGVLLSYAAFKAATPITSRWRLL